MSGAEGRIGGCLPKSATRFSRKPSASTIGRVQDVALEHTVSELAVTARPRRTTGARLTPVHAAHDRALDCLGMSSSRITGWERTHVGALLGPAWVGIGAQRSGTTWFSRMFTSHPGVSWGQGGRKEQHWFNRYTIDPWDPAHGEDYAALFPSSGDGEFTPAYMRLPMVAEMLAASCRRPPLLIALLRDPLARFASSMRWQIAVHGAWEDEPPLRRSTLATQWTEQATLGSMYGPQLAIWRDVFGADQMIVVQFEQLRADPESVLERCWHRLGLEPVSLQDVTKPSRTSTRPALWTPTDATTKTLIGHVSGAVDQAVREWGIALDLWPDWSAATGRATVPTTPQTYPQSNTSPDHS